MAAYNDNPDIVKALIEAGQLYALEDYVGGFRTMQKIIAVQRKHVNRPPDEFHFKYAEVALSPNTLKIAIDAVNEYLMATGKTVEFYKQASSSFVNRKGRAK